MAERDVVRSNLALASKARVYNTEGGSDAGFNRVGLGGPSPTPTPSIGYSDSPAVATPRTQK